KASRGLQSSNEVMKSPTTPHLPPRRAPRCKTLPRRRRRLILPSFRPTTRSSSPDLSKCRCSPRRPNAQRLAQMANGRALDMANENTSGSQLSNRNFTDAVTDLLDRGARPDLVVNHLASGRSDHPRGHEFAPQSFRPLETHP